MAIRTTAVATQKSSKRAVKSEPSRMQHSLTVRLDDEQYRVLRDYVYSVEQKTREKISHQSILVAGLAEYLARHA